MRVTIGKSGRAAAKSVELTCVSTGETGDATIHGRGEKPFELALSAEEADFVLRALTEAAERRAAGAAPSARIRL